MSCSAAPTAAAAVADTVAGLDSPPSVKPRPPYTGDTPLPTAAAREASQGGGGGGRGQSAKLGERTGSSTHEVDGFFLLPFSFLGRPSPQMDRPPWPPPRPSYLFSSRKTRPSDEPSPSLTAGASAAAAGQWAAAGRQRRRQRRLPPPPPAQKLPEDDGEGEEEQPAAGGSPREPVMV
jgi:hypothetical protein